MWRNGLRLWAASFAALALAGSAGPCSAQGIAPGPQSASQGPAAQKPAAASPAAPAPVTVSINVQIVRTTTRADRFLASLLLPPTMVRRQWPIYFELPGKEPFVAGEVEPLVLGEKSGYNVTATLCDPATMPMPTADLVFQQVSPPSGLTLARMDMIVDGGLTPDQYKGHVRFRPKSGEQLLLANIDLRVRDGPCWPFVVVLLGIGLGRVVQSMSSPTAQMQFRLLNRLDQLRTYADQIHDQIAHETFLRRIQDAEDHINLASAPEADLTKELDAIGELARKLLSLQRLELEIAHTANAAALAAQVDPIRSALLQGDFTTAATLQAQLESALSHVQGGAARAIAPRAPAPLAPPAPPAARPQPTLLLRVLAFLTGSRPLSASERLQYVQPLLYLLLLLLLALVGMKTLYVDAGATFGSAGLYDYLGLLLWGLSADVAQRSLQQLQTTPRAG